MSQTVEQTLWVSSTRPQHERPRLWAARAAEWWSDDRRNRGNRVSLQGGSNGGRKWCRYTLSLGVGGIAPAEMLRISFSQLIKRRFR